MKTVKLASTKYYDELPIEGNEYGQAFRDTVLEAKLLEYTRKMGYGAQFGGKYFALDVRVVRLPRHGASCPLGLVFLAQRTATLRQGSTSRHLA